MCTVQLHSLHTLQTHTVYTPCCVQIHILHTQHSIQLHNLYTLLCTVQYTLHTMQTYILYTIHTLLCTLHRINLYTVQYAPYKSTPCTVHPNTTCTTNTLHNVHYAIYKLTQCTIHTLLCTTIHYTTCIPTRCTLCKYPSVYCALHTLQTLLYTTQPTLHTHCTIYTLQPTHPAILAVYYTLHVLQYTTQPTHLAQCTPHNLHILLYTTKYTLHTRYWLQHNLLALLCITPICTTPTTIHTLLCTI